ncbi:MAG: hypothetical protein AAB426_03225 [Myxococcota bacterium]
MLVVAVVVGCGCGAIDDFSPFHIVSGDGGADFVAADVVDAREICVMTLAGVAQRDFTVRFRIRTATSEPYNTVLYQRAACGGGERGVWAIRLVGGVLRVTVGETVFDTSISVVDGVLHDAVVQRRSGVVAVTVDGRFAGARVAADSIADVLPPLGVISGDPCEKTTQQRALDGSVTAVCLMIP